MTETADLTLSVVDADKTDIDWLIATYLDAASGGHFDYDISDREILRMVRVNLRSIVLQKKMKDFGRMTRALIFERDGVRIGTCIMAQIHGQPSQVELHILLVDPRYRNMGYGKAMLGEVISRWHYECDIYVRCFPVSGRMIGMLDRRGFMPVASFEDRSTLYMLPRSTPVRLATHTPPRYPGATA